MGEVFMVIPGGKDFVAFFPYKVSLKILNLADYSSFHLFSFYLKTKDHLRLKC